MEEEQIVFVDEHGRPTGETGPKLASHTALTRLHLAFSCHSGLTIRRFGLTSGRIASAAPNAG